MRLSELQSNVVLKHQLCKVEGPQFYYTMDFKFTLTHKKMTLHPGSKGSVRPRGVDTIAKSRAVAHEGMCGLGQLVLPEQAIHLLKNTHT